MKRLSICFLLLLLFLVTAVSLVSCKSQKVQELVKENEQLHAKNEALRNENAELRTQNEELKRKLAELESKDAGRKSKEEQIGQSAREAVKALQKLEARCMVGVSYIDYARELGETLYQVKSFLESPESAKTTKLSDSIKKTIFHYIMLKEVWDYEIKYPKGRKIYKRDLYERISSLYPNAPLDDIESTKRAILDEAFSELKEGVSLLPK